LGKLIIIEDNGTPMNASIKSIIFNHIMKGAREIYEIIKMNIAEKLELFIGSVVCRFCRDKNAKEIVNL